MRVWSAACRSPQRTPPSGRSSRGAGSAASPPTISLPTRSNSMLPIAARWPRILSEQLVPVAEPLTVALAPERASEAPPQGVVASAARALLDGPAVAPSATTWPAWLAPHQVPAAERLNAIIARHGGALLADEVGLGKSYVALAVALARQEPFVLVVPAVLVAQWRALLDRFGVQEAPIITHERLSVSARQVGAQHAAPLHPHAGLFVIDEAHRFRNPETNRYRSLARLVVGSRVLLVTATPTSISRLARRRRGARSHRVSSSAAFRALPSPTFSSSCFRCCLGTAAVAPHRSPTIAVSSPACGSCSPALPQRIRKRTRWKR